MQNIAIYILTRDSPSARYKFCILAVNIQARSQSVGVVACDRSRRGANGVGKICQDGFNMTKAMTFVNCSINDDCFQSRKLIYGLQEGQFPSPREAVQ